MAGERKPRTRKSESAKSTDITEAIVHVDTSVSSSDAGIETAPNDVPKRKATRPVQQTKKALPLDTMVCCVSGVAVGKLLYHSKRLQGCSFEWNRFGDEQYIELVELQSMRNAG